MKYETKQRIGADILADTLANGGGSYLPATGQRANIRTGYMVSMKGRELQLDTPATDDQRTIARWVLASRVEEMVRDWRQGAYLGTWIDQGRLYIDHSVWVEDRAAALQMGRNNDQLAIWDCAAGASIPLAAVTA
jgi:hypothetical protein